jgi:hypothetical protein
MEVVTNKKTCKGTCLEVGDFAMEEILKCQTFF